MENIDTKFINNINNKQRLIFLYLKNKRKILSCIFILFYVLLFFLIDHSSQSLVAHDEGLYARRSRLLEQSYNWFSSPFAEPHHKTIGSYWLIALSIRIFGNSEFALRLPSILASFLCLIISYLIALKISNKNSAFISVFALSAMPLWIQYSRYASPDIPFVLCILLVILFFLEFIDTSQYFKKYLYIFASGLLISIAFFIRSYMVFVPLIGLTPFLVFHLNRNSNFFKTTFLAGIFVGSFPTILTLYFSYKQFGNKAITILFDFARKQAIGEFDFANSFLLPLNYLYLTFPIGILFIILFIFTRSNNNIKYPLLTYCYPLISFLILICMSTSYPHYYLFLLPNLSILFSTIIESFSFRFLFSRLFVKYILILLNISISSIFVYIFFNYRDYFRNYITYRTSLIYIISTFLIVSFIFSIRHLFNSKKNDLNLIGFLKSVLIPQYISLSMFYNFGILGSPNLNLKLFLNDEVVSSIVNSNTIYLYNVDSKIQTLLSYYLPTSKVVKSYDKFYMFKYIITSDKKLLYDYKKNPDLKLIKNFNNHSLLMNISE